MVRILLALLSFAAFLFIGVMVERVARREGLKSKLTIGYILVSLFPALWSLGYSFMYLSETAEQAMLFYKLSSFGWCLGPSATVYFTYLLFTQYSQKRPRPIYTVLIFLPYPFLLYGALSGRMIAYKLERAAYGWREYVEPGSLWVLFYIVLVLFALILAVGLLLKLWRKAKLNKHRLQAKLIILPVMFISPVVIIIDLFLPLFGIQSIPHLSHLILSCWILFMGIGVLKYPMLRIDPRFAIDSIIFNMHELMLLTDLSWNIVTTNPAVQSLLGYQPDSLEGENLARLVDEEILLKWKALDRRQKDTGESHLITRLGESIPVRYVLQNVRDECDDPVGYLLFLRDISEMKRLENLTGELQKTNKELARMSITDSLTQVYNRQKIEHEIEMELDRFRRYATVFSIIMFDLDFFKEVNDEHGHDVGDKVLIEVTKVVQTEIRSTDLLARWGGEEFIVLCPGISVDNVVQQSDRIRKQIENHTFGVINTMTVSFGVTEVKESDTIDSLMKRADIALYKAKESGRNRVRHV